jgi:hypothetical protein
MVAKAMSAATPLTTRILRLDDAARMIEKYGVDMADSISKRQNRQTPSGFDHPKKAGRSVMTISFLD